MTKAIHILATADAVYGLLKPYMPAEPVAAKPRAGRPAIPTDIKLHLIVKKLKTGLAWDELGPNSNAVFRLFQCLEKAGSLPSILQAIIANKNLIGFSQDELIAATEWLINGKKVQGPIEAWLGQDYEPAREPKQLVYGPKQKKKKRPAIRTLDEQFISRVEGIFNECLPKKSNKGRPRLSLSAIFNGLLKQNRTGMQWIDMPHNFGHPSTIWLWRKRMKAAGVYERLHAAFVAEADSLGLIQWHTQMIDGSHSKARKGGEDTGPCPVDRGKTGVKRSIQSEASGLPIAICTAAANVSDKDLVEETLRRSIKPTYDLGYKPQMLLDRGYYGDEVQEFVEQAALEYKAPPRPEGDPYFRLERDEARFDNGRRVFIEHSHAWLQNYRAILVRYSRKTAYYEADIQLAAIILIWGRIQAKLGE